MIVLGVCYGASIAIYFVSHDAGGLIGVGVATIVGLAIFLVRRKKGRAEGITAADVGRFVFNTRRGRVTAAGYVGGAVLLGLTVGLSHPPQGLVNTAVYVVIAVPIIFDQTRRSQRPPDGSRE